MESAFYRCAGARNRNRTLRVHGINAPCLTAHKPPFPDLRIMLLISIILFITSITKFLPEQRVDRDRMIQSYARSSTSTKNSQNKTMHRRGRSAALNFRNHFGGHSVMVVVRASHRISSYSYSAKRYSVKRYSYSMAVLTAAMPIVDRGGSRELADQ